MRKQILFIILLLIGTSTIDAQTKGSKVGYIDMEYILQNVPGYIEASAQLEAKAQKWKQEIEEKKIEINKLTDALKAEKPLLTAALIEERETEIKFLETEKLDYQQKKFGANGDLTTQKSGMVKPIQDQIFTAVQDIAEAKKYDFVFDKSSHLTILFAAKRFDISDQVIRILNRSEKREQLTSKQLKQEQEKDNKEDALNENPDLSEKEKALADKKTFREKLIEAKKLAKDELKIQFEEKRKQLLDQREAKKNGTIVAKTATETTIQNDAVEKNTSDPIKPSAQEEQKKLLEEKRKKIIEDREAIKKGLEEKRAKDIADRAAKKNNTTVTTAKKEDAVEKTTNEVKSTTEEIKTSVQEERKKALEDRRKKTLEQREAAKKALEEKRLKDLEEKEAAKKANQEGLIKKQ